MKIALIGYGKMGHIIERIALERGHEIVSKVDVDNQEEFESEAFASADVAIEFTIPAKAVENYRKAWAAGVPVVSGTTGWNSVLPELKEEIAANGYTLFWASNFSLGVNLFFELNKRLAQMMNRYANYDVAMTEIHHTEKKDAPSGTGLMMANEVTQIRKDAELVFGRTPLSEKRKPQEIGIHAIRGGGYVGEHEIDFINENEVIKITHEAFSKSVFADGALKAAKFIANKPANLYEMKNLFE